MTIIHEIQNIQQGLSTEKEVAEKVANLPKKERIEILDELEWLAEYGIISEIKKYI